jgi:excisionase family DNA binding protein
MKAMALPSAPLDVLTVEELAALLKVNPQTVYRRFRAGEIPGVRIGRSIRFPRSSVEAWLRLRAAGWTPRRTRSLFEAVEAFAVAEGISEEDVLRAVKERRRRRR